MSAQQVPKVFLPHRFQRFWGLALALLTLYWAFGPTWQAWAQQEQPIGTLGNVIGKASVLRAGKTLPATKGMPVFPSDTLVTGDKTAVKIVFNDGGNFMAFENSSTKIQEYKVQVDGNGSQSLTSAFEIAKGKVRFFVKPQPNGTNNATYKTSNAVMGVRGTSGFIDASTPGKTQLVVLTGKVEVQNPSIPGQSVLVPPNFMTDVVGKQGPTLPKEAPPALLTSLNTQAATVDPNVNPSQEGPAAGGKTEEKKEEKKENNTQPDKKEEKKDDKNGSAPSDKKDDKNGSAPSDKKDDKNGAAPTEKKDDKPSPSAAGQKEDSRSGGSGGGGVNAAEGEDKSSARSATSGNGPSQGRGDGKNGNASSNGSGPNSGGGGQNGSGSGENGKPSQAGALNRNGEGGGNAPAQTTSTGSNGNGPGLAGKTVGEGGNGTGGGAPAAPLPPRMEKKTVYAPDGSAAVVTNDAGLGKVVNNVGDTRVPQASGASLGNGGGNREGGPNGPGGGPGGNGGPSGPVAAAPTPPPAGPPPAILQQIQQVSQATTVVNEQVKTAVNTSAQASKTKTVKITVSIPELPE